MTVLEKIQTVRPPEPPADLGEVRTVMAADRTLMAWVRTALSMLGFSFTIYKFLEEFESRRSLGGPDAAQHVGLFLAGLGTLSIVMGTIEYWATLRELNGSDRLGLGRPVLVVAMVLSLSGVALFITIALHLF